LSQEKSLIEPGYFGSSVQKILIIDNFIEIKDLNIIQNFLPHINKWMDAGENIYNEQGICTYDASYWANRQCSSEILKEINPEVYNIINKYIIKMKFKINEFYNVKVYERPPVIIKWNPGTEQQPHADKQLPDGSPNPFPTYDINSLFYYNDDFEGGELFYPEFDLTIKPEPGLAVAHPGDIYYLHGVKKVISGYRYTTPSFYTIESFK